MNPDQLVMPKVDDQTKAQIKMLTFRNFLDESQASEAENFRNNFKTLNAYISLRSSLLLSI